VPLYNDFVNAIEQASTYKSQDEVFNATNIVTLVTVAQTCNFVMQTITSALLSEVATFQVGIPGQGNFSATVLPELPSPPKPSAMDFLNKGVEQIGKVNEIKKNVEQSKASTGTITKVATAVSAVAAVASLIPVLTPIAAPVAVIAAGAAAVAHLFGWSKPTTEAAIVPIQHQTPRYFTNYDGLDMSKVLALEAKNGLAREPLFGSDVDEMAVNYIASTPTYLTEFNFKFSNVSGDVLATIPITPQSWKVFDPLYVNIYAHTLLSYISNFFTFWRGEIKFAFRFVKTKFHSGRLRIIYAPHGLKPDGTPYPIDADKCYSEVIDLREKSEFEFTVPFVSEVPWRELSYGPGNSDNTGCIVVQVLNELRGPATLVSDTVPILVEIAAGEDFQLARPRPFAGTVISNMTGVPTTIAQAQVGQNTFSTREQVQLHRDGSKRMFEVSDRVQVEINENTVGETVMSTKQLINRMQGLQTLSPNSVADYVLPDATFKFNSSTPVPVGTVTTYYQALCAIFAFQRGGMRVKVYDEQDGLMTCALKSEMLQSSDRSPVGRDMMTSKQGGVTSPLALNVSNRDGVFEVEMPYYQRTFMIASRFNSYLPQTSLVNLTKNQQELNFTYKSANSRQYFVAAADDFQMGCLIGAPLVAFK